MAVQIGARPDSGFDDPIGMLKDCHRRIESFLGILHLAVRQAAGRALSVEERQAVEAALHYFRESGLRHNRDEEDSLFPRMQCAHLAAVAENVRRLEAEHQQTGLLHDEAALLYSKWIAEERLSAEDKARLLAVTESMLGIYKEHIRLEEEEVFPCAAQFLSRQDLDAMGSEFKARRA